MSRARSRGSWYRRRGRSYSAAQPDRGSSLTMLIEEVEHAFQVGPDDVAVRAARHFHVLMFDAELRERRDHAAGAFDGHGGVGVAMHDELGRARNRRNGVRS